MLVVAGPHDIVDFLLSDNLAQKQIRLGLAFLGICTGGRCWCCDQLLYQALAVANMKRDSQNQACICCKRWKRFFNLCHVPTHYSKSALTKWNWQISDIFLVISWICSKNEFPRVEFLPLGEKPPRYFMSFQLINLSKENIVFSLRQTYYCTSNACINQ